MSSDKISVYMAPGEDNRTRPLEAALKDDNRYISAIEVRPDLPVDLQFRKGDRVLNVEIKDFTGKKEDNSDYLNSILNAHLKDQVLTMREETERCRVLVLGDDMDILAAILKAVTPRYRGKEASAMIRTYWNLIIDFEANCEGLRSYVWYFKTSPWKRLLSRVDKVLNGPDDMLSRPTPAEGKRDIAALSMLFRNFGPKLAEIVLHDYDLVLIPKPGARTHMPGIGPKRAALIETRVRR
jgi:hypothetical protein